VERLLEQRLIFDPAGPPRPGPLNTHSRRHIMAQDPNQQDDIQPLSDESLEEVAGGVCSWSGCSNGASAPAPTVD
jgi:hypothetical protein